MQHDVKTSFHAAGVAATDSITVINNTSSWLLCSAIWQLPAAPASLRIYMRSHFSTVPQMNNQNTMTVLCTHNCYDIPYCQCLRSIASVLDTVPLHRSLQSLFSMRGSNRSGSTCTGCGLLSGCRLVYYMGQPTGLQDGQITAFV